MTRAPSSRRVTRWAVALGLALAACSPGDSGNPSPVRLTQPEDAIGDDLMLALLRAKNFHQMARVYMSDGKLPEATAAVRQVLTIPFPDGAAEAEDVRHDARALLAKLLVGQGQLEAAMTVVDEGLAGATRESFFVANLYTVRSEVLRAQAAALDASDKPRADDLRRQAIMALEKSNQIAEALQKRLLGGR